MSNSDAIKVEYGRSTIRARWYFSGTATVQVKSRYGDHITHIMNVTVIPHPPQEFDCTAPVGLDCRTLWYDDKDTYTVTSTDTSVVNVTIERYTQTFADGPRTMERLKITGVSQGTADVYIYENGDHTATVHMTITPAVPSFSIGDHNVTIDQWETVRIPISSGGWGYTDVTGYDRNIALADADTNADNLTGEIDITGKDPGYTEITFRDQYYQEEVVRVTVEDTILDLHQETLTVSGTNYEYITAREAHTAIKRVETDNDHATAQVITISGNEVVVKVSAKSIGTTVVTVFDHEENSDTVVVTVGSVSSWGGSDNNSGDEGDLKIIESNTNLEVIFPLNIGNVDILDEVLWSLVLAKWLYIVNTEKCAFGNIFIDKPDYASCVDDYPNNAWECNDGFTETSDKLSCRVSLPSNIKSLINNKVDGFKDRLDITSKIEVIDDTLNDASKINQIASNRWLHSETVIELLNYYSSALNERKNQIFVPTWEDIYNIYSAIHEIKQISSQMSVVIVDWYTWNINAEVWSIYAEKDLDYFLGQWIISNKEYKELLNYTPRNYSIIKKHLDNIKAQLEPFQEVLLEIWHTKGSQEALQDFILGSFELLDITEIWALVTWMYSFATKLAAGEYWVDDIVTEFRELKEIYDNRDEIFAGLTNYEKWYYIWYLEATLALTLIPAKYDNINWLKNGSLNNCLTLQTSDVIWVAGGCWNSKVKYMKALHLFNKKSKFGQPSTSNNKFVLLKNWQGWKDKDGDIWKKDQLHKDHWDISDGTSNNNKIMEIDFNWKLLWPAWPKNNNK